MSSTEDKSRRIDKTLWVEVYKRILTRWQALCLALLFIMGMAATQPAVAFLMQPLLDNGFGENRNPDYVWMVPIAIVVLFSIRGICSFLSNYLMSWVTNGVLADIRGEMYQKMMRLPDLYFKEKGSSALLNRFVIDANNVTSLATEILTTLVRETMIVLSLVVVLLYLSWKLTVISFVLVPVAAVITRYFSKRLRKINRETIETNAALTSMVSESIDGQRVIKLFNAFNSQNERFIGINARLRRHAIRNTASSAAAVPLTQGLAAIALAGVVAVAMSQSGNASFTVGSFAAFVTAMIQMLDPLKRLSNLTGPLERMMVAAESVFNLLKEHQENDHSSRSMTLPVKGEIVFNQLSFSYPNADTLTLNDVSFSVPAGKTVALIGRSGSGKSTLASMVPRFIEPQQGSIIIDGQNIQDLSLESLREQISLVSQDVVLFDDTIAANIAFGSHRLASDEQIRDALKAANLLDFVESLPDGMYAHVGENATRLSGGQRQRLAIARALIKNAPILILDEATSALDNESERQVQASLDSLMHGRTTLVIAHRLSTIVNADWIVVLDEGKVIEQGVHKDLLASQGAYAALYHLQFAPAKE